MSWLEIDKEVQELIEANRLSDAEALLLRSYQELMQAKQEEDLDYIVGYLAQFYSMPEVEDQSKAERFFLEREKITVGAYPKLQTAMFYFYVVGNFSKTIEKVNEIHSIPGSNPNYYSGLALKGQALIELNRIEEAGQVLDEMQAMTKQANARLPYGDEVNFLERAISIPTLEAKSRTVLVSIIPRMRSEEYAERAKHLLG